MEQVAKINPATATRRLPGRPLPRAFFHHAPDHVSPRLLGMLLVHTPHPGAQPLAGRIVEVEAYLGPHNQPPDRAAHAHNGPTPRNRVLFGPAAHAYVYAIYGRYFCMNVSCEMEGLAGCVLLRALEPVLGQAQMAANRGLPPNALAPQLTSGPSRLCQALGLNRISHNGLDLLAPTSPLQLRDDGFSVSRALVTPRIGIRHAADWPLRFALPGSPCLSGPRNLSGSVILLA